MEIIEAFGLRTRTWTHHAFGYGCAECCIGDRCDSDCDAPYKGRRAECPHCKGRGWIKDNDVTSNKSINEINRELE